ncbi:hypothetical protein [Nocardioides sp. Leaf285]|uniref:hypothetical protein n=1 Tax=Nocardioides sp. Leaf285 TaxID=1736322 RepID=UPI000703921B|nr:hypothetical protein [Nocardioides sp. Leaf285]KQP62836.1 hypothetical protein ASF47_17645 [Nocardioides sp. Leaf285]
MRPASERLDQHTVRVWVAADSFGPLAERVRGMLLGDPASCGARGRLMSVITLFPHGNRAAVPEIHTSMSLDPSVENPIVVRESDYDHRLNVALAPGPHSFGFGYPHRPSHRTEQDAARRAPSFPHYNSAWTFHSFDMADGSTQVFATSSLSHIDDRYLEDVDPMVWEKAPLSAFYAALETHREQQSDAEPVPA